MEICYVNRLVKSGSKLFSLCLQIRVIGIYWGDLGLSFYCSINQKIVIKKNIFTILGIRRYINQINKIYTNPSGGKKQQFQNIDNNKTKGLVYVKISMHY